MVKRQPYLPRAGRCGLNEDRLISFVMSERGLNNAKRAERTNVSNIAVVMTGKNAADGDYLTFGEYESSDFYGFTGGYVSENRHVVWLTDFTDINENVTRAKPLKLADNVILVFSGGGPQLRRLPQRVHDAQ